MNRIRNFFWLCSGANKTLLEDCPTDASKYAGIGATVFFTGVFAALAGFYAMYSVFDSAWIAALAGLIWGTMIFNLDRYIVSSMRKKDNAMDEFKIAFPRIVLAVLIAIVISKPLEMKIFEKEIQEELVKMELENQKLKEDLVKDRYTEEVNILKSETIILKGEILSKTKSRDSLRLRAQLEADGTGGTMRRNAGPIYRIKKADADKVEEELAILSATNNELIKQNNDRIAAINTKQQATIASLEEGVFSGLAARMEALSRLTKSSSAIWIANWFILLLFIAIETAPVFVKLLSPTGPYDYKLETIEYQFQARLLKDRALVNKLIKKKASTMPNYEKEFVDEQLEVGLANGSKF